MVSNLVFMNVNELVLQIAVENIAHLLYYREHLYYQFQQYLTLSETCQD